MSGSSGGLTSATSMNPPAAESINPPASASDARAAPTISPTWRSISSHALVLRPQSGFTQISTGSMNAEEMAESLLHQRLTGECGLWTSNTPGPMARCPSSNRS